MVAAGAAVVKKLDGQNLDPKKQTKVFRRGYTLFLQGVCVPRPSAAAPRALRHPAPSPPHSPVYTFTRARMGAPWMPPGRRGQACRPPRPSNRPAASSMVATSAVSSEATASASRRLGPRTCRPPSRAALNGLRPRPLGLVERAVAPSLPPP